MPIKNKTSIVIIEKKFIDKNNISNIPVPIQNNINPIILFILNLIFLLYNYMEKISKKNSLEIFEK